MVLSAVEPGWWEEVDDEWCPSGIPHSHPAFWAFCTLGLHWDHGGDRRALELGCQDRAPGAGGMWMWHSWALWPGAQLSSVQASCDKCPPASLGALSLLGTLPPCLLSSQQGSEPVLCPQQGCGSRKEGATRGAALLWLSPAMERAQALQGIRDMPVFPLGPGTARRLGLQGGL